MSSLCAEQSSSCTVCSSWWLGPPSVRRRREMQGEVALAYFCVLLIVGGWCKRKENARWSAAGGVGGTLCQCVNDPGEDDCWLVAGGGGVPEPSSPRGRGLPALRVVVTLFTLPRPWRRSMIMATRRPSEQLSWSKCPHPDMSRAILSKGWCHLLSAVPV